MKAAIITIIDPVNIGNRLQNYAVQELLKAHGCQADTLIFEYHDEEGNLSYRIKSFLQSLLIKTQFYNSFFFLGRVKKSPKMVLTEKFNRKYIHFNRKFYYETPKMSKHYRHFDYYCVGSDQIWNPIRVQTNDFYFLKFAPSERTFSMAVSMGISSIPDKYQENFREGFEHVGHLSVRENSARDLIREMTGRDATVLLDPTLLLDSGKWHDIATKPAFDLPDRYLATYFLSDTTDAQKALIQEYAKKNDLAIIDINQTYASQIGPLEFLYVIEHAQFLFTDSFHGTAFSLIFGKDFLVFQRNKMYDMSSRITTILQTFQLENRFYSGDNHQLDSTIHQRIVEIKNQDTQHVKVILEEQRQIAHNFLKNVFA